jgi:phospholipase/carboxylesterase
MHSDILQLECALPPVSGSKPGALVILLHGVGANGEDLMSLAHAWHARLPDALFISPDAPDPYDSGYPGCYQWFSLEGITPENRLARVQAPALKLNAFIDEQLAACGLTDRQLVVVGFSQGTIMALCVMLRRQNPCAGLLGYSGRLAGPDSIEPVTSRPRILLTHGTRDEVIPVSELYAAEQALQAHQVPVVAFAEPGVSHTISPLAEALGGHFIQYCLTTPDRGAPAFAEDMGRIIGGVPQV